MELAYSILYSVQQLYAATWVFKDKLLAVPYLFVNFTQTFIKNKNKCINIILLLQESTW